MNFFEILLLFWPILDPVSCDSFSLFKPKLYRNIQYRIGRCQPNQTRYPFKFNSRDLKVTGGINTIAFENKFEILEDLYAPFAAHLEAYRCSIREVNECSLAMKTQLPAFCTDKDSPLAFFIKTTVSQFDPPLGCLVQKKGKYTVRKSVYDLNSLAAFPLEGFRWKLRIASTYGESDEPLLCTDWGFTVLLTATSKKKKV